MIRYDLPVDEVVRLEIYDVGGQRIRTLMAGERKAGVHLVRWDSRDDVGRKVGSGVYFYRLDAGEAFTQTRRMVLIR